MTAILVLRDRASSLAIHERLCEQAAPPAEAVGLGAMYYTLDRLEDTGFVTSWLADPGLPGRRARSRRYYRLEAVGERVLQKSRMPTRGTDILEEIAEQGLLSPRRPSWKPVRQH